MLDINKELNGTSLLVKLTGRLDLETSQTFDAEIVENLGGIDELKLDCNALEYISSAGLRELLKCAKKVDNFAVVNASDMVKEALTMTDFDKIFPCS